MTDPQRRAVEAIDSWFKSSYKNLGYGNEILARVRSANLVILDRETVKLAVRWGEFVEDYGSDTAWTMTYDAPALKQMQDALGDDDA